MLRFGVREKCKEEEVLTSFILSLSLSCLGLNRKLRDGGRLRRNRGRGRGRGFGVRGWN
jgi:hypothetical protein